MTKNVVDAIVIRDNKVLLIERAHYPEGLAFPGGHVDEGETCEHACKRELEEETHLKTISLKQFHTYSDPDRDPRGHYINTVFIVQAEGEPRADDDAKSYMWLSLDKIEEYKEKFAFDHYKILKDYLNNP